MVRNLILILTLALSACAALPPVDVPTRKDSGISNLPAMKVFGNRSQPVTTRSNATIARDFMDLSFRMESGKVLPTMTRFEGPILVALKGDAASNVSRDLGILLSRIRNEAGIEIREVRRHETANLLIQSISRGEMQRYVPTAACFVVPNVVSWSDFKKSHRRANSEWANLQKREMVSIFVPNNVSPQEVRDCLHEEVAQAIGPLNDLYRLDDSVFNDDNFHSVLTGFDMLVLRAYYDPALKNGMTLAEVSARIPSVLARINPRGQRNSATDDARTPRDWINAIEVALGPKAGVTARVDAAKRAVMIAKKYGWRDNRLAFSTFVLGRVSMGVAPELSTAAFLEASAYYTALPGNELQSAHINMQLAANALSSGDSHGAIKIVDAHMPAAIRGENAAVMATLLMIKAQALSLQGRESEARMTTLDSLGWARYGFGSDANVLARLREISALSPAKGSSLQ